MKGYLNKLVMWLDCILEKQTNKKPQAVWYSIAGKDRQVVLGKAGEDPNKSWWERKIGNWIWKHIRGTIDMT